MWYILAAFLGIGLIALFGWIGALVNILAISVMVVGIRSTVCQCKLFGKFKNRVSLIECHNALPLLA